MDLIEFRRALRRHLRASLVVAILVLGVGLFATRGIQPKYQATSTVLVTPRAERFQAASASVLRVILPNVIVVTRSSALRDEAAPSVPARYSKVPITVSAAFDPQASSLFVTVQSKDAYAVAWSAALAKALEKRMKNDPYLVAQVLDPAESATPTGRKVRVLGFVEAFGLAMIAFVLVAFGAQRLEESRDVTGALRKRGVRVLGSVGGSRRRRADRDGLSVITAALAHEGDFEGPLIVVALTDERVAQAFVDRVRQAESMRVELASVGAGDRAIPSSGPRRAGTNAASHLDAVVGPLLHEFSLGSAALDIRSCVLAVDEGASSVAEILAAVKVLDRAGVTCRGVVFVHVKRTHRARSREEQLRS